MSKSNHLIDPRLKLYMGFGVNTPDIEVVEWLVHEFSTTIEKPCTALGWCPYGPLVEQFPLPGLPHDPWQAQSEPSECTVFGHLCPAHFVAEPFTDPESWDACVNQELRDDYSQTKETPGLGDGR